MKAKDKYSGRTHTCPACKSMVTIPAADAVDSHTTRHVHPPRIEEGVNDKGFKFPAAGNVEAAKNHLAEAARRGDTEAITIMLKLDKHNIEWLQMAREHGTPAIKIIMASQYCAAAVNNKIDYEKDYGYSHEKTLTLFKSSNEAMKCVARWIAELESAGIADGWAYVSAGSAYQTEFTKQGYDRCMHYYKKALAEFRKTKKNDDREIAALEFLIKTVNEDYRNGKYKEEVTIDLGSDNEANPSNTKQAKRWGKWRPILNNVKECRIAICNGVIGTGTTDRMGCVG